MKNDTGNFNFYTSGLENDPSSYPNSSFYSQVKEAHAKWNFLFDNYWLDFYLTDFSEENLWVGEILEELRQEFQKVIQKEEFYQIAYLKKVPEPANGVITAPGAVKFFQKIHPWKNVRNQILDLVNEDAGCKANLKSLELIDSYLIRFNSTGILPETEVNDWRDGFQKLQSRKMNWDFLIESEISSNARKF